MNALYTSYRNGSIRDANSKLVGFYDGVFKTLDVDGYKQQFCGIENIEHAMDKLNALMAAKDNVTQEVSFESLAIYAKFTVDGLEYSKQSDGTAFCDETDTMYSFRAGDVATVEVL